MPAVVRGGHVVVSPAIRTSRHREGYILLKSAPGATQCSSAFRVPHLAAAGWPRGLEVHRDGHVVPGPATQPQPRFEAFERNGQVEIRLPKEAERT